MSIKELPMLFKGAMVCAIQDDIKTQTRRLIDGRAKRGYMVSQPVFLPGAGKDGDMWSLIEMDSRGEPLHWIEYDFEVIRKHLVDIAPYGDPGDHIWVRETLRMDDTGLWRYSADDKPVTVREEDKAAMLVWANHKEQVYCPSIHMPRWASRVTVEVTAVVRVERLQDITEEDAKAEGAIIGHYYPGAASEPTTYREAFAQLWDSINGKIKGVTWADNPWVWVVTFKRIEAAS